MQRVVRTYWIDGYFNGLDGKLIFWENFKSDNSLVASPEEIYLQQSMIARVAGVFLIKICNEMCETRVLSKMLE
jgi:hypothetical protein